MPIGFPPEPRYPLGIDDDFTLFLVFNTSETPITEDNPAWSDEILIKPQSANEPEIWADNGFANLNGELLYYDAVEKNSDGKIFKFKRCARNLGGSPTQFSCAGDIIRGYVIAEHHNQLVDAVIRVEGFVGENFSEDPDTVDFRVRELEDTPDCTDDLCPDVTFDFEVVSEDACEGTTISYTIDITGSFDTFLLEFGDGSSTTSTQDGTHTYAPNAKIDPVVRAENNRCTIIQTGVSRTEDDVINIPSPTEPLLIPIPTIPDIPPVLIPEIEVPEPDVTTPPVVFPCIDLTPLDFPGISIGPIDIQVPSIINVTPPIPSVITVVPPVLNPITVIPPVLNPITITPPNISPISLIANIPSVISLVGSITSVVSLVGSVTSVISVMDDIPSSISLVDNLASTVSLIHDVPSQISVVDDIPSVISVDWGTPPTVSCTVSIVCPDSCPSTTPFTGPLGFLGDEEFDDDSLGSIDIDYDFVGIPSVIKVESPEIPTVTFNTDNIPSEVKLTTSEDFPSEIKLTGFEPLLSGLDVNLIMPEEKPEIKLDASSLPESIELSMEPGLSEISLVAADDFPRVINVDGSSIPSEIQVAGIPSSIALEYPEEGIPLVMPEKPEVEMVYKGSPVEVVLKMDDKLLSEGEGHPCFALVPCNPK